MNSNVKLLNPKVILDTSISAEFMTLKQALTLEFGIPAMKEDETNLKAIVEDRRLNEGGNLAYIEIDDSIKAFAVINGKAFEGGLNIEHLIIDKDGAECPEGHRGCLSSLMSAKAIIKKALIMMIDELAEVPNAIVDIREFNIENLTKFLSEAKVNKLTNEIAGYLRIALINLKNLLNIRAFVLAGKILHLSGLINKLSYGLEEVIIKKSSVEHQDILRRGMMIKLSEILNQNKMTLIVSLPQNRRDLAEAAVRGGADALKVHANVFH